MESVSVAASDGTILHVGVTGSGPDVVLLSGGPGCVQYLGSESCAPLGVRAWFPEPRGVGRSGGGPHDMARAVADLESVRVVAGVTRWRVVGHSWGGDLALRYALDHPDTVDRVVASRLLGDPSRGLGGRRDRSLLDRAEAFVVRALSEIGVVSERDTA